MKWFLSFAFIFSASNLKAQVAPEHVEDMLKQMVRENVISAEEAQKAKLRLRSMNTEQWKAINDKASKIAARSPASVASQNKIEEVHGVDLDGAQFKEIQNEMKRIVPQYRD